MNYFRRLSQLLIACLIVTSYSLFGHEGHHHLLGELDLEGILHYIGQAHLILVHFPIALVIMTVVAEILHYFYPKPIYDHAARFMIVTAAILVIPTALAGLAFSYNVTYEEPLATYFWWHRFFGLVSGILVILAAILRELFVRRGYYVCLAVLFVSIILTGYFGGLVAF